VREELRRGLPPREAVIESVTRVGKSITFSAGTVIAAPLSLLPATFGLYSGLAAPLAIGIGLMLLAGLTLLPAVLAILGRAVFWPTRVRPGPARTGLWGRVSTQVVRHPVPTLLLGLAVFGGLAAAAPGYQAAGLLGGAATAPNGRTRRRPTPCWPGTSRRPRRTPRSSCSSSPTQPGTTRRRWRPRSGSSSPIRSSRLSPGRSEPAAGR
jgi:hypothetical protein